MKRKQDHNGVVTGAVGTGVALSDEGDLRGPLWAWTWGVRERAGRNVWVKKGCAWRHGEKGSGGGNQMKVGAVNSALSVTGVCGFWEKYAGSDVHIARTTLAAGGEQTVGEQGRMASPLPWAVINSQSARHGLYLQETDNPLGGVLMASLGAQALDGRLSSSGSQGSSSLSNAEISFLQWPLHHFYAYRKFTMIPFLKADRVTPLPPHKQRKSLHSTLNAKTD